MVLGTPAYLSPEHACDGSASPHSDMWALAVVAYEGVTGRQPFPGRNLGDVLAGILSGALPPLSTLCPEATPELEAWFTRAFALDPVDRFPSMDVMIEAYDAAVGAPPPSEPVLRDEPAPRGRKPRFASVGLIAALGLGVPAAVVSSRGDAPAAWQASIGAALAVDRIGAAAARKVAARGAGPATASADAGKVEPAVAPARPADSASPAPPRAARQPSSGRGAPSRRATEAAEEHGLLA